MSHFHHYSDDDRLNLIYFACYPQGDRSKITVIDLESHLSYEKSDWAVVDPHEFYDRSEAINHARQLANKYGLEYQMFESRYNSEMNEYLDEFDQPNSDSRLSQRVAELERRLAELESKLEA